MRGSFAGEVVVVTGGSGGIGRETAVALGRRGAKVYVAGRSRERLEAVVDAVRETGGEGVALRGDVSSFDQVRAWADEVSGREGKVDLLINAAGVLHLGPISELDLSALRQMMEVNYLGVVHSIKAFLPLLRSGARRVVINVSSLAGRLAPPYFGGYAASKFAVSGYSHALRQELRPEGIRVVLIYPGPVETSMIQGYVRGEYYPLPPGVPVIGPGAVAKAIVKAAIRPRREIAVPGRLKAPTWLGSLLPGVVDVVYRPLDKRGRS